MRLAPLGCVLILGVAANASADALAPRECPHSVPVDGSRCESGYYAACTYSGHGPTRACTCRDGRWRCQDMPPPPS